MKILHILSSFDVGGAEVVAIRLAAAQASLGAEVMVVGLKDGPLRTLTRELGLRHAVIGRGRGISALFATAWLGLSFRPDIVNSHNPNAHKFGRILHFLGSPTTVSIHGMPSRNYGGLMRPPTTATIIAVSGRVRDRFLELHPRTRQQSVTTILNGVNTPSTTVDHDHRPPGNLRVLVAARLDPVKDLATMLRAVAIAAEHTDIHLTLAGDGAELVHLKTLAHTLGVQSRVEFLGMVSDMASVYPTSDVIALSSLSEGLPMSLLEGMAWGLPVVSTAVGGIPEVVSDGVSGLLVAPGDPAALADALVTLAREPSFRTKMGAEARKVVAADFGLEKMAREYLAHYHSIIDR